MPVGGGAGLLGNCWLVVAVTTEVLTLLPASVMTITGFEGIPEPIWVARVWLALELVSGTLGLLQFTAAYPVII